MLSNVIRNTSWEGRLMLSHSQTDLAISATGMITPVSLLASITVTRQVFGWIAFSISSGRTWPFEADTGTKLTSKKCN